MSFTQATTAVLLLAINDRLKSICINGAIGSGKSELLSLYTKLSDRKQVVIPTHITFDRLFGGISLDETLKQQKIVYEESIFERTEHGVFFVEHVDRFDCTIAKTIVRAVEEQSIQLVRDEVIEKSLSHTALYTTQVPFEQLQETLLDCISLSVTLETPTTERRIAVLKDEPIKDVSLLKQKVGRGRKLLPNVTIDEEQLAFITKQLIFYNVHSMRAHFSWIQAARAFAALQNELKVTNEHIQSVEKFVLNHRTNLEMTQSQPPTTSENEQQKEFDQREDNNAGTSKPGQEDELIDVQAQEQKAMSIELEDKLQAKKVFSGKAIQNGTNKRNGRQIGNEPYNKAMPDVDVLATLKKAIPEQPLYEKKETKIVVKPHHFVNKKRQQKQGQHFIFVVDASQSMHQNEQMIAVKGVVLSLLKDAYQKRNMISFISMYQQQAEIKLHTSKNISLARQMLQNLKVGGKTPLASALDLSQKVIETSAVSMEATKLIIFTDGRANITLTGEMNVKQALQDTYNQAEQLRKIGVQTLIVDTEQGKVKLQKVKELADKLQGHYILFSDFTNKKTYQFIRYRG